MPTFTGSRENSLEEALNARYGPGVRKYFHVTDFENYPDAQVLVKGQSQGVEVILPDYTLAGDNARQELHSPTESDITDAALDLIRKYTMARLA